MKILFKYLYQITGITYRQRKKVDYGSFIYDLFRKIEVILLVFKELSDFEKDNLNDDIVETYIQNSEFMKNLLVT